MISKVNTFHLFYLWQQLVNKSKWHLIFKFKVWFHEWHGHPEHSCQNGWGMGNMGRIWENAGINTIGWRCAGPRVSSNSGKAVSVACLQIPKQIWMSDMHGAQPFTRALTCWMNNESPSVLPVCVLEWHYEEDQMTDSHIHQTSLELNRSAGGAVKINQWIPDQENLVDLCSSGSSVCHLWQSLVRMSCELN